MRAFSLLPQQLSHVQTQLPDGSASAWQIVANPFGEVGRPFATARTLLVGQKHLKKIGQVLELRLGDMQLDRNDT